MRFEERVGLGRFLDVYAAMRVRPSPSGVLRLEGKFGFKADHEGGLVIEDVYRLRIDAPHRFPKQLPVAWELGERVPRHIDHHVYEDGSLCLGSPLHLYLIAHEDPDLTAFAQRAIVPYLYAASYRERTGGRIPSANSHTERRACSTITRGSCGSRRLLRRPKRSSFLG